LDRAGQRMRLRGNAYPYDNPLANFIAVETENSTSTFTVFRFVSAASEAETSTPYRSIQPDTNYGGFNFQQAAPETRPGHDEWVLETAAGAAVLSTDRFDTSSITISNPVKNELSIQGLTSNVNEISIYSLLGQKVLTRTVATQSSLNIDVSTLKTGMYLVEMKGDTGSFVKKVIKQ